MAAMKTSWKLPDIIDLEYFQNLDQETGDAELHRRDRDFYLRLRDHGDNPASLSRRRLLQLWLAQRRLAERHGLAEQPPGQLIARTLDLLGKLAGLKGLVVGLLAGLSFFTYSGETPVNVFHFLLVFIIAQLLLALLALAGCSLRLFFPQAGLPSLSTLPLRLGLGRLLRWIQRSVPGTGHGPATTAWTLAVDTFRNQTSAYGALFYWPLFLVLQRFAIFFNLGLLAATLTKVAISDLAFGWQSTLRIGTDALYRGVGLAATPWSWLFSGNGGYPSLAEIEGSRIILKDGISHMATGDLVSWWPFLVLCLLVYGLLPRLAFAVCGRLLQEWTISRIDFDTAACRTTIRRMKTPLISSQADPEQEAALFDLPVSEPQSELQPPAHLLAQVVLVPDDIFGLCPGDKLEPLLAERGFAVKSVHKFLTGYDEDEEIKTLLAEEIRQPQEGLLILMEGWMPPLVAFLTYLKELREVLPEKTMIHLALVGRPMRSGFSPLPDADLHLWRKKTSGAKDPYLHVFPLLS
jgi:Protein of unknown function (DUF2868)